MFTELYKAIKTINIDNLSEPDKFELLKIFIVTQDVLVRDHLAFIFSDLRFNEAVPFIISRINEQSSLNNNGSLVYSLDNLDTAGYFLDIIKIICDHGYEARLQAYELIEKNVSFISEETRKSALKTLEEGRLKEDQSDSDKGENSRWKFIEKTIDLLHS